jgi:proline dehydrogenase
MSLFDRAISLAIPAVPKPIVRRFSKRYIAGPTVDDAFRTVRALADEGAMATLDILGESIMTLEAAEGATREYEDLIARIREPGIDELHVSVKLTALGLLQDHDRCMQNVRRLCEGVRAADSFLRIDMEDSPCTSPTLAIYHALRSDYPQQVGAVLQSRLRRTLDDVEQLTHEPANVRLCKGIYLEPRSIAYTGAELIRRNFVLALDRLLERGAYVGIATHDELLVWEALRLIDKYRLGREQYEFQMLLGVDEQLRRILIEAGHRLRVYVPFGVHWYAYSVRRLRENPQIAGHAFRAIFQRTPTA